MNDQLPQDQQIRTDILDFSDSRRVRRWQKRVLPGQPETEATIEFSHLCWMFVSTCFVVISVKSSFF